MAKYLEGSDNVVIEVIPRRSLAGVGGMTIDRSVGMSSLVQDSNTAPLEYVAAILPTEP